MRSILKYTAVSFALLFSFSSCESISDLIEGDENRITAIETESTTQAVSTESTTTVESTTVSDEDIKDNYTSAAVSFLTSSMCYLNEEQIALVSDAVNDLKTAENIAYTSRPDAREWELIVVSDSKYRTFYRVYTSDGWFITDNKGKVYKDSDTLNTLISEYYSSSYDTQLTNQTEYYSVDCSEPSNEKEYLDAAVKCTEAWLKSLQSPETDDYYRNKGFEITVEEDEYSQKSNYLSCGMVNGKKEFVVEICFTADDCGSHTFYDDYYQEGRYTEAGTYWSGQYICGRYRWDNGKCSLIDMTTRDGSESIQHGLNGIHNSKYKTFFDFARRSDYKSVLEDSFVPFGEYTVSRNLTQTEDGKPINIDIYTDDILNETEKSYTAIWDKRAYINKESTYITGLYFTDGGTGHMPDKLPKDFQLTFDNYDGDANPDFCCRYDSDEDGTFYFLDSVQSDGRIFNLSGRAFEGGIYIAGCNDPSPRLQKTDTIAYVGWKKDGNGYYPTDSQGERTELPDLNMYSDRYYLPDDIKKYSEDENKVTCFLWNNTENNITTDSSYSIEMKEMGKWKTVADGLSVSSVTVKPRRYAEITYDISSLKERYDNTYRIVQKSGELTAGGNFCLEGREVRNVDIRAADIYKGARCGKIAVRDYGNEPTVLTRAYITDGTKKYDLKLDKIGADKYVFISAELPEKSGKYKLVANDSIECSIVIK